MRLILEIGRHEWRERLPLIQRQEHISWALPLKLNAKHNHRVPRTTINAKSDHQSDEKDGESPSEPVIFHRGLDQPLTPFMGTTPSGISPRSSRSAQRLDVQLSFHHGLDSLALPGERSHRVLRVSDFEGDLILGIGVGTNRRPPLGAPLTIVEPRISPQTPCTPRVLEGREACQKCQEGLE